MRIVAAEEMGYVSEYTLNKGTVVGTIKASDIPVISAVLKEISHLTGTTIRQFASMLDVFAAVRFNKEINTVEFTGNGEVILSMTEEGEEDDTSN